MEKTKIKKYFQKIHSYFLKHPYIINKYLQNDLIILNQLQVL